jgi:hypothetical protein
MRLLVANGRLPKARVTINSDGSALVEAGMHEIGGGTYTVMQHAKSANNRWCAVSPKKSENCGYATLDQCRAQVLGLGGWCSPWRCGIRFLVRVAGIRLGRLKMPSGRICTDC